MFYIVCSFVILVVVTIGNACMWNIHEYIIYSLHEPILLQLYKLRVIACPLGRGEGFWNSFEYHGWCVFNVLVVK